MCWFEVTCMYFSLPSSWLICLFILSEPGQRSDFIHSHAKRLYPKRHPPQTWPAGGDDSGADAHQHSVSLKYLSHHVSTGITRCQSPCLELPVFVREENRSESWRILLKKLLGLQGWLACWLKLSGRTKAWQRLSAKGKKMLAEVLESVSPLTCTASGLLNTLTQLG